jgi:cation:H+ antiporter
VFVAAVIMGTLELAPFVRHAIAIALLLLYAGYGSVMLRLKRAADAEVEHGLYFERIFGRSHSEPHGRAIAAQVAAGLFLIVLGAKEFVDQVVAVSQQANLNPGVLSLIISPLATELPEKFNSVIWIRQGKDHLALANITGAMVFQSCIPVALGLSLSPWHLSRPELLAGAVAIASAIILYINVRDSELGTPTLIIGGVAYGAFLLGLRFLHAI